jgi:hypothetical protein
LAGPLERRVRRHCRALRHLTALSTIENPPYRKVFGECLKTVLDSCRDEQQIARFERILLPVVEQNASAPDNDVDLVLGVWGLFVRWDGERELYVARTALQDKRRTLAGWTWDRSLDLR